MPSPDLRKQALALALADQLHAGSNSAVECIASLRCHVGQSVGERVAPAQVERFQDVADLLRKPAHLDVDIGGDGAHDVVQPYPPVGLVKSDNASLQLAFR